MNRMMVSLPDGVHAQLKQLAKREGVSVAQYVTYAIAKQVEQANQVEPGNMTLPVDNLDGNVLRQHEVTNHSD